jgi:hypothetical protein
VKNYPEQTPKWVIEESLKVVAERLKSGTKLTTGSNDRKLYKRQIKSYYRWRCVHKYIILECTVDKAAEFAANELKDTFVKGSDKTFKEDYYFMLKELEDSKRAFRYYSAMPDTRELTGTSLVPIHSSKARR